ncbi:hypothetical protein ACFE04_026440 [Oxalis oulophora]
MMMMLLLLCLSSSSSPLISESLLTTTTTTSRPAGRALKSYTPHDHPHPHLHTTSSSEHSSISIVVAPDGTLFLWDANSDSIIWSFPTGPPIYSAYQDLLFPAPYFLHLRDHDFTLFATDHLSGTTFRLEQTIDDFIKQVPIVADNGGLTLGSKTTVDFLLDAKNGNLLSTFTSPPSQTGAPTIFHKSTSQMHLHITRTDYELRSVRPNSYKDTWNLTIAEIKATLFCHNTDKGATVDIMDLTLQCQSLVDVFHVRIPDHLLHLSAASPLMLALQPKFDKSLPDNYRTKMLPPSASHHMSRRNMTLHWPMAAVLISLVAFAIYCLASTLRAKVAADNFNLKVGPSKRKKVRKSGKNVANVEQKDKHINEGLLKSLLDFNTLNDACVDGRRIGKLFVTNSEIAKGSNGTVVLEGIYEGRPVAVKRLVLAHHDVAFKEVENLIASDSHPNIVRWYGVDYNEDFVYLSLERCTCSLDDLIQMYSDSSRNPVYCANQEATRAMMDCRHRLDSLKHIMGGLNLWKENGHPSPILLKLMRDMVYGLLHLHELGIIHRDIKPQNVLIKKEKSICAKLSDMGISKRLHADMSSLGHRATGNSGWQAPEQLLHGRQTRAMDMFGLGCVLFFGMTSGRHPFGDILERDVNIVKNQIDLFLLENLPEAKDLIFNLLNPVPELRPNALEVLHHPIFWNSEMRLSFLRDTSDRVELEDRERDSDILRELESIASTALGGKWDEKMERAFITNIGHYRRYKYDSVRDLLRVMRNKLNHYRELPNEIQELIGPVPEGFDG